MSLQMFVRAIILLLLAQSLPAIGQGSTDSVLKLETLRFVRAYRIDKVAQLGVALSTKKVQTDVSQGKVRPEIARCFISTYSVDEYVGHLTSAVQSHFQNVENLKSLNDFFESPVGTKMLDQLFESLTGSPPMMLVDPSRSLQLTDQDVRSIAKFEASPSYQELAGFIKNALPKTLNYFSNQVITKCTSKSEADLIKGSVEMAKLEAEIDKKYIVLSNGSAEQRKYVGSENVEPEVKMYLDNCLRKILRIGNEQYPEEARIKQLHGKVLATLHVTSDGNLEKVEIDKSSGSQVLDSATSRAIQAAAPFEPFPAGIRAKIDVLSITRSFIFERKDGVTAAP